MIFLRVQIFWGMKKVLTGGGKGDMFEGLGGKVKKTKETKETKERNQ